MRFSATTIACLAAYAAAFPVLDKLAESDLFQANRELLARQAATLTFDPYAQKVSVSGDNAYRAPSGTDFRGPCPGLNAMANHGMIVVYHSIKTLLTDFPGYIPRNGYTTVTQAVAGMQNAYGISPDFGTLLSVLGSAMGGDGLSFSIGGPPPKNLLTAIGLLGAPQGMSNTHNRFESDQSITRHDLYQPADAVNLNMDLFKQLLAMSKDIYTLDTLGQHIVNRFEYSKANNPYFFKGIVAAFIPESTSGLTAHVFANHSQECPEGCLDAVSLKSFFGVTGSGNNLKYTPGTERIPENWYKYPAPGYGIAAVESDIVSIYAKYSNQAGLGGNMGKVNTFTGLDVSNITGGVYNAGNLLQGNNLGCFLFQLTSFMMPDMISEAGIIGDVANVVAGVTDSIKLNLAPLNCPQLTNIDKRSFALYPGWTKSKPQ